MGAVHENNMHLLDSCIKDSGKDFMGEGYSYCRLTVIKKFSKNGYATAHPFTSETTAQRIP